MEPEGTVAWEQRISEMKTDIIAIGATGLVTIAAVVLGTIQQWDTFLAVYWQYSPNAYRLSERFMLYMNSVFGFSIVIMMAVTFFVSFVLAYFVMRPLNDMPLFMLWMLYMACFGYIMNGPMYLLLCILARYSTYKWAPLLMIPLVLVKEVTIWLALGYLISQHRWKSGVSVFIVSATVYGALRFLVIGNLPDYNQVDPSSAPFFIPIWIFTDVLPRWGLIAVGVYLLAAVLVILSARRSPDWRLWAWAAMPNVSFALFYEPQLWLPVVMMQQSAGSSSSEVGLSPQSTPRSEFGDSLTSPAGRGRPN